MADNLDQSFPLLQEILNSLSQSADQPQTSVSELISLLNSTLDAALSDPENEDGKANAFRALTKVHQFVSSPSLDQAIIEALSFELPMTVSNFGGVSDGCLEVVECTIDCFISMCSPRDMLSILCEGKAGGVHLPGPGMRIDLNANIGRATNRLRCKPFIGAWLCSSTYLGSVDNKIEISLSTECLGRVALEKDKEELFCP